MRDTRAGRALAGPLLCGKPFLHLFCERGTSTPSSGQDRRRPEGRDRVSVTQSELPAACLGGSKARPPYLQATSRSQPLST